jgi:hypothetical protein
MKLETNKVDPASAVGTIEVLLIRGSLKAVTSLAKIIYAAR